MERSTAENKGSTTPPEYRMKLAELATQLASAQISASAQVESSRHLAAAVMDIAAEFLRASARLHFDMDKLATGVAMDLLDYDFVGTACAKLRRAASYYHEMPREQTALDHRGLDVVFAAALSRAQEMLMSPALDTTLVFAEQLFLVEEEMSEKKMEERFASWDWDVMKNHEPFLGFMKKLENWYAAWYKGLFNPIEDSNSEDERSFIEHAIEFCSLRNEDQRFRPLSIAVEQLASSREHADNSGRTNEGIADSAWHRHMIQCIFCGRIPGERKANATRNYAPWALFRYLRVFGQDHSKGQALHRSLQLPRAELGGDLQPHPLDRSRSRYDFGPLSQKAEKLSDEHDGSCSEENP